MPGVKKRRDRSSNGTYKRISLREDQLQGAITALYGRPDSSAPIAATLPEPEATPEDIERGSLEELKWRQSERRRIFVREVACIRQDWVQRRDLIIDRLTKMHTYLSAQLDQLTDISLGTAAMLLDFFDALEDIEDKVFNLKHQLAKEGIDNEDVRMLTARKSDRRSERRSDRSLNGDRSSNELPLRILGRPSEDGPLRGAQPQMEAGAEGGAGPVQVGPSAVDAAADESPSSPLVAGRMSASAVVRFEEHCLQVGGAGPVVSQVPSSVTNVASLTSAQRKAADGGTRSISFAAMSDPVSRRTSETSTRTALTVIPLRSRASVLLEELGLDLDFNADRVSTSGRRMVGRASRWSKFTAGVSRVMKSHTMGQHRSEKAVKEGRWTRIVVDPRVESWCMLVILVHAIVMGVAAQAEALIEEDGERPPWLLTNAEHFFYAWYIFEVLVKLWAWRFSFFTNDEWRWNLFDVFCLMPWQLLVSLASSGGGTSFFRVLRLLKLARMLRVIRFMRAFRELRLMVYMMTISFRRFLWTVCLLVIIIYTVAMVVGMGLSEFVARQDRNRELESRLLQDFDGVWSSMKTLLFVVTHGAHWFDITLALWDLGELYYIAFMAYIVIVILGLFNMGMALFCQAAAAASEWDAQSVARDLEQDENALLKSAEKALKSIVDEKSQKVVEHPLVNWEEFSILWAEHKEVQDYLKQMGIEPPLVRQLFHAIATTMSKDEKSAQITDEDSVEVTEFLHRCKDVRGHLQADTMASIARDTTLLMRQLRCLMVFFEDNMDKIYVRIASRSSQEAATDIPMVPLVYRLRMARSR